MEIFNELFESISTFDLIYLIITTLSLIKCFRKGFILSLLSALKWLLAYISTLFLFPKIKPFVKNVIDNEHILNIGLSVTIFILAIFVILTINKGISKTISHLGLGNFDKIFGFFFGFIRGYIICVCLFTAVNILYNYSKWPLNLHESLTFSYVKKGSNYLIKEFPDEENYKNTKKQIEEL